MCHAGDIKNARETYLQGKNQNLQWLLKSRFIWMNEFIGPNDVGIELGSGIAASKDFINSKNFLVSDFLDSNWLDLKNINALKTGFISGSFDYVIVSNTIHHLAYPKLFFQEAFRILKPEGKLIIQDTYSSFFMRLLNKVTKHEGYNETIDVFSDLVPCNEIDDPWSANCSIPKLLFKCRNKFGTELPGWNIIHYKNVEFFKFANSGGVIAKTKYIKLSTVGLKIQDNIDQLLCWLFPKIFSLQLQVVLEKGSLPLVKLNSSNV
jgi:SAM-dependent methyltransferase